VCVGLLCVFGTFNTGYTYFQYFVLQLHIFVQLQQDVQAKYPEFLTAVVGRIIPNMTKLTDEDNCQQRLFSNFIQLCQWNNVPDTQQSARYMILSFFVY